MRKQREEAISPLPWQTYTETTRLPATAWSHSRSMHRCTTPIPPCVAHVPLGFLLLLRRLHLILLQVTPILGYIPLCFFGSGFIARLHILSHLSAILIYFFRITAGLLYVLTHCALFLTCAGLILLRVGGSRVLPKRHQCAHRKEQ